MSVVLLLQVAKKAFSEETAIAFATAEVPGVTAASESAFAIQAAMGAVATKVSALSPYFVLVADLVTFVSHAVKHQTC